MDVRIIITVVRRANELCATQVVIALFLIAFGLTSAAASVICDDIVVAPDANRLYGRGEAQVRNACQDAQRLCTLEDRQREAKIIARHRATHNLCVKFRQMIETTQRVDPGGRLDESSRISCNTVLTDVQHCEFDRNGHFEVIIFATIP